VDDAAPLLPLVVLLGFAGGTPAALQRYADKLYYDHDAGKRRAQVLIVTASEVPEIYEHNVRRVLRTARGRPSWSIHLFSKAGFLTLSRICDRLREERLRHTALQLNACVISSASASATTPPRCVVWDSSPGSMSNFAEFIQGTWQSALLIAKRGQFTFSDIARGRMEKLLASSQYSEFVRDSYSPMLSLSPFPFAGCKHCFIFQKGDPVSSADEIKRYATEQITDRSEHRLLELSQGTHCDGLWWSGDAYMRAVHGMLSL
jgi:hypothetical protein